MSAATFYMVWAEVDLDEQIVEPDQAAAGVQPAVFFAPSMARLPVWISSRRRSVTPTRRMNGCSAAGAKSSTHRAGTWRYLALLVDELHPAQKRPSPRRGAWGPGIGRRHAPVPCPRRVTGRTSTRPPALLLKAAQVTGHGDPRAADRPRDTTEGEARARSSTMRATASADTTSKTPARDDCRQRLDPGGRPPTAPSCGRHRYDTTRRRGPSSRPGLASAAARCRALQPQLRRYLRVQIVGPPWSIERTTISEPDSERPAPPGADFLLGSAVRRTRRRRRGRGLPSSRKPG